MKTFRIAKVLFKSMFKKPATLMYPVVQREWQERTRGSIDIEVDKCIVCGICAKRCPADAIEVERDSRQWTIHRMQCIQCGECVQACPKKCLAMNNQYTEPQTEKVVDTYTLPAKDSVKSSGDGDLSCNKDECVYCGLCVKACPADALKVDRKEKLWEVDKDACAKCGACVEKCPKKCLSMGEASGEAADASAEDAGDEKLICDMDECVYCGLCAKNCPCDALNVDRKEKLWEVDEEACVKCGACVDKCPKKCLKIGVPASEETEEAEQESKDDAPASEEPEKADSAEDTAADDEATEDTEK